VSNIIDQVTHNSNGSSHGDTHMHVYSVYNHVCHVCAWLTIHNYAWMLNRSNQ